jgi:dihydrolipoamide dehydrogenase
MAEAVESELIVLGGGPGGYTAAFLAADQGMQVTLIDASERPGGTCLHVGCIPSKALLHVAKLVNEAKEAAAWGVQFAEPRVDIKALRAQTTKVTETLSKNLVELCKRRKVELIRARGVFTGGKTIELADGTKRSFKNCIIATGSLPAKPPLFNIESPRIMDSTGALKLEEVPEALLVVGGGYIGLELGCVYAALGSKVTVVELTDGLLPGCDRDLVRPLQQRLEHHFHKIHLNTKVTKLTPTAKGVKATLEGAEITDQEPEFGRVLVAVGRSPNTRNIGLDKAGVELDGKGFIKVDKQMKTSAEGIYAIGDAAGEPMLAHKASFEGKLAVEVIHGEPEVWDVRAIPAVIFTDPEIAWCGLTETQAKQQGKEISVLRFPWAASGRAATLGRQEGLTKIVVEPGTERVLGVGIVGYGAGELISEGVLAVEMGATARDLSMSIHPHPTLSETIMEAAESAFGPTTHIYKVRKETAAK